MLQPTVGTAVSAMFAEQCMPEANVEHLHIVRTVWGAVVLVPFVLKTNVTKENRQSCRELVVSCELTACLTLG